MENGIPGYTQKRLTELEHIFIKDSNETEFANNPSHVVRGTRKTKKLKYSSQNTQDYRRFQN